MISCIYKITSISKPERFYIGSAKDWVKRKREHKGDLKRGNHCNTKLQNHVNKYGLDDLTFNLVGLITDLEQLIVREQYYLDLLKPYFNICPIAGSCLGRKHTQETIDKIRKSNKGLKRSDETRKNIAAAKTGVPVHVGSKHTEETKAKMRNAKLGTKASEQTRLLMSLSARQGWEKRKKNG